MTAPATILPLEVSDLVYEAGSGWEPLCAFLDCPVPDEPYPHRNTRAEIHDRHMWRTDPGG